MVVKIKATAGLNLNNNPESFNSITSVVKCVIYSLAIPGVQ